MNLKSSPCTPIGQFTRSLALSGVLVAALLSGCASGPLYSENKNSPALIPQKDCGLIIAYSMGHRPARKWAKFNLFANGQQVTSELQPGGFFSFEVKLGPTVLSTKRNAGAGTYALAGAI